MSKKIAFIFPGQGAQYIGMGKDFLDSKNEFDSVFEKFEKEENVNLKDIMLNGPEEKLKETKFTQPAILLHSISAMETLLKEIDLKPDFVAGHSLGEFSALVANKVLSLNDALHLVHKRGQFMMEANNGKPFAMSAIIGLKPEEVKEICKEASKTDLVIAANFNTPVQTVISGSKAGVEKANNLALEKGAAKAIMLKVGGPFHSPLIEKAKVWLTEEMEKINFTSTDIPVVSNVDATPTKDAEDIKSKLSDQIISSVLWLDSVNYLIEQDVDLFIEFGPKKVLKKMFRKINRKAEVISIDKGKDLKKALKKLKEIL